MKWMFEIMVRRIVRERQYRASASLAGAVILSLGLLTVGMPAAVASPHNRFQEPSSPPTRTLGHPTGAVVAGGLLYLTSNLERLGSTFARVLALRPATGRIVWSRDFTSWVSAPALGQGRMYVTNWAWDQNGTSWESVVALDATNGHKLWSVSVPARVDTLYTPSTPAVAAGVVYVGASDGLHALNASTGAMLWTYETPAQWGDDPVVVDGGAVYFVAAHGITALNASDGTALWSHDSLVIGHSSMAVAGGVVYFWDQGLTALRASDGARLWSYATGNFDAPPVIVDGVVYVAADYTGVTAVNAATGARLWVRSMARVSSGVAVAGGVIYVASGRDVLALKASNGTRIWSRSMDAWASGASPDRGDVLGFPPIVFHGMVYAMSAHQIYALRASTGHQLWTLPIDGSVRSSPTVSRGVVYVSSDDHRVYALKASTGAVLWRFKIGGMGLLQDRNMLERTGCINASSHQGRRLRRSGERRGICVASEHRSQDLGRKS